MRPRLAERPSAPRSYPVLPGATADDSTVQIACGTYCCAVSAALVGVHANRSIKPDANWAATCAVDIT